MKVLHLVRKGSDPLLMEALKRHSAAHETCLVLLKPGVSVGPVPPGVRLLRLKPNGASTDTEALGFNELISLIFYYDRVFCW